MKPKKTTAKSVSIDTHKHKDKRLNIPTSEMRDFVVADEEKQPKRGRP